MAALDGKRAIVTGASSGIGATTARALAEAGARVAGGARRTDRLETELALPLDVTDTESCARFVEAVVEEFGGIDILINNAGLSRGRDPVWESSEQDEREVIEANVLGLMRITRLCVPYLVADGGGHIVNMGSIAGIWSYPNGSSYVASKFAVHGYTRSLRDDLQGKPVRITNVAPGLVETEFSEVRFHGDRERAAAVYKDVAMGGPLHAEDVCDCIMFALTRPPHVNVDEIVLMALAQVSGGNILREA
ncbi:MAG TPA: SDR family NAD(P)-dependent oxidoreductase [Gaiellaceae bacterium]|nr:SDR family NAD(P)-dependent oxidoreductase [Gaiellaceae bacterium]